MSNGRKINVEKIVEPTNNFLGNVDMTKKDALVPPKPKPGELIYCQLCGSPMYPQDFSKDKQIRKMEFKWRVHNECKKQAEAKLDMLTPGVIQERRALEKRFKQEEPKEVKKPKSLMERNFKR